MDAESTPDYEAILAARGSHARLDNPEATAARRKEQQYRASTAQTRARAALQRMYPEDWRALYELALKQVDEERGPLPGDEDAS